MKTKHRIFQLLTFLFVALSATLILAGILLAVGAIGMVGVILVGAILTGVVLAIRAPPVLWRLTALAANLINLTCRISRSSSGAVNFGALKKDSNNEVSTA